VIKSWAQFDSRIRYSERPLLRNLSNYPKAILVAGCQRSGTTAVTRILRESHEFETFAYTADDELDAALILAGDIDFQTDKRVVFQTTFINNHLEEYFEHSNYQLIWVMRNPQAVVKSMVVNWKRGALNRLFKACGVHYLSPRERARYDRFGHMVFTRLRMACTSYQAKTHQTAKLIERLGKTRLLIVDYDDLIEHPNASLSKICDFVDITLEPKMMNLFTTQSKSSNRGLSESKRREIASSCSESYATAQNLAKRFSATQ